MAMKERGSHNLARSLGDNNDHPWLLPSGKLTWQWKMNPLKMYSLLNSGDFPASYVSLLEGNHG